MNLSTGDASQARRGRLEFYDEWNRSIAWEVVPIHASSGPTPPCVTAFPDGFIGFYVAFSSFAFIKLRASTEGCESLSCQ
jgi:hypothetical protein